MDVNITAGVKDALLEKLINRGVTGEFNLRQLATEFNMSVDLLQVILTQFEEYNLVEFDFMLGGTVLYRVKAGSFDLVNRGGFTATEELLQKNIEKLMLEVEKLKSVVPDRADTIAGIVSAISSALALFK